jgi:NADH-quinone oxidoreductase subunit N
MLVGIVVASEFGVNALVFYLAAYALMNLPAFAVILIRERETALGDDISALAGIGRDRPALAWPITISMLALAGLPGTVGFIGKLFLIEAAVDADFTWLGVAIAIGTMISLGYYLRVIAVVWMRPAPGAEPMPAMAGGSSEADSEPARRPPGTRCPLILVPTWIAALATVVFGVVPSPLVDWAANAGTSLFG